MCGATGIMKLHRGTAGTKGGSFNPDWGHDRALFPVKDWAGERGALEREPVQIDLQPSARHSGGPLWLDTHSDFAPLTAGMCVCHPRGPYTSRARFDVNGQ